MRFYEITTRVLERALWVYRSAGIIQTTEEFSVKVLARKPSYYDELLKTGKQPDRRVLQQLVERTKVIMANQLGSPFFAKPSTPEFTAQYEAFEWLVEMLNQVLEKYVFAPQVIPFRPQDASVKPL